MPRVQMFTKLKGNTMSKETLYDILSAILLGLALACGALAYFDVLTK
jgi:hypothetical protein